MGAPLDLARVRLQQRGAHTSGIFGLLSTVVRTEGVRALFRGMSYPLVTMAAQQSLCFQAYGAAFRMLRPSDAAADGASPGEGIGLQPQEGSRYEDAAAHIADMSPVWFAAGCYAGGVQCIITVPQELLKIRLQVQRQTRGQPGYCGPLGMVWKTLRREGPVGLYHGTSVTLLRDVPSYGVYFVANEVVKEALEPGFLSRGTCSAFTELVAGGTAGSMAWASIYPIEIVKCRVQAEGRPWRQVVGGMLAEGPAAFTKGMTATLLRAFVVNAAIFYGYGCAGRALRGA